MTGAIILSPCASSFCRCCRFSWFSKTEAAGAGSGNRGDGCAHGGRKGCVLYAAAVQTDSGDCHYCGCRAGRGSRIFNRCAGRICLKLFLRAGTVDTWQMFAFGIVGFLGGLIFRRKRGKWKHFHLWLCIYGGTVGAGHLWIFAGYGIRLYGNGRNQ